MAPFPAYPEDLTPAILQDVIARSHPRTTLTAATVRDARGFGATNVSTSALVMLDLCYSQNPAGLPNRAVVKMAKTDDWPARGVTLENGARQRPPRTALYSNEVSFYLSIAGEAGVRAPHALGAGFDVESGRFALILEDLSARDAQFPSQYEEASRETAEAVLDGLAQLHATYWNSPRLNTDLGWLQPPHEGPVADCINGPVRKSVSDETASYKFKRELLGRIGTNPDELFANLARLQRHQARLPQTLIHGDAHFGNTFRLPDGFAGFYDWQLVARGYCMQDCAYLMVTMLSIEQRRKHERDLLRFYRERLLSHGVVETPSLDNLWLEYRRAMQWCVTIGWLPCPPEAYGWELVVIANNRTTAAYEDLETTKAIEQLA